LGAKPYIAQHYGPGFDRRLDTSSNEKLVASVTTASANLYPDQAKALRWAVSDLNDETIKKRYPNATMREIVRGEAKGELAKAAAAKADTEKQLAKAIKVQSNVEKSCRQRYSNQPRQRFLWPQNGDPVFARPMTVNIPIPV
jgi:hypothetical protein